MEEGHWGTRFTEEGQLTVSWNPSLGGKLEPTGEDVLLLELRFNVLEQSQWEELFSLGGFVAAEAYTDAAEILGIGLEIPIPAAEDLTVAGLLGNAPNPFSKETFLKFSLRTRQETTFRVLSATGAEVDQWALQRDAGVYQERLDGENWPSGVLYLEMINDEGRWVQKMIHVRKN